MPSNTRHLVVDIHDLPRAVFSYYQNHILPTKGKGKYGAYNSLALLGFLIPRAHKLYDVNLQNTLQRIINACNIENLFNIAITIPEFRMRYGINISVSAYKNRKEKDFTFKRTVSWKGKGK